LRRVDEGDEEEVELGARRGAIVRCEVVGERCGASAALYRAVERCAEPINRAAAVATTVAFAPIDVTARGSGLQQLDERRAVQWRCGDARAQRRGVQRTQCVLCCGVDIWARRAAAKT
jgi:hypothetical protein